MNSIPDAVMAQFSGLRSYTEYEVISDDNCIITSDWEIPDLSILMVQRVKDVARAYNIRRLVIAGDLIATDQDGLNTWVDMWKEEHHVTFGSAIGMTIEILKWLMADFDHIHILRGNHDDRVAKATQGEVHLGNFLDLIGLPYSQYAYMYLNTSRGPTYICHPRQYSSNSLGLGQKLYNVTLSPTNEKCHVVLGHTHQAQFGKSPDGLRDIVALGCMRDLQRTKYVMTNVSTLPKWTQGFLMIRNGYFHPLVEGQTDWSFYLDRVVA